MKGRLASVNEAAAYCGLKPVSFRAWIKRVNLNCKIRGTHKYDMSEIDRWLDRQAGIAQKPISAKYALERELDKERSNATVPRRHKRNKETAQ